ncbi:MAG: arsenosugar biosynthesis arsenite methyltransferase ArsM [Planctomycetes bacterium]|nr:arsenosugar biosynthesis arsenite methyltransferase ArsM [Planctomycetota bacterium]
MSNYLQTVEDVYEQAANAPDANLCCTQSPVWNLPDLRVPPIMLQMNYGCGSTVNPRDLRPEDTILYVGVGGGLEALQFAYFTRRPGGVIAVDPVAAMRGKAQANFIEAARLNPWFRPEFVRVLDGNALKLPVESNSVSVAAQNCLFNVFKENELEQALAEVMRVLRIGGFFTTSDPITPTALPEAFRADEIARARCLSGCQTFDDYVATLVNAGFGRVDVRARIPYRLVTPGEYPNLTQAVLLESVEVVAYKVPDGLDGPAIFTGRHAIYGGAAATHADDSGLALPRGIPVAVSDAAAARLARHADIVVTPSTFHARGAGCC